MKIAIESTHHLTQFFQASERYGHQLALFQANGPPIAWKPKSKKPDPSTLALITHVEFFDKAEDVAKKLKSNAAAGARLKATRTNR